MSLLVRARQYFGTYAEHYMSGDAETIATSFYSAPFLAVRGGIPRHLIELEEVVEHLRGVMAAYRASGAAAAHIHDISVYEQGNAAVLVTIHWHIRRADETVIRELPTSYQLVGRDSWTIVSYVNHDTVDV